MKKWFKFTSPQALTQYGHGSEEQARTYTNLRGRRNPGTIFVEVDGEPDDEGATIVNLGVAISEASF